jgi:predicted nucleotide-binding protein (sugar kinase/HSP70/actin superfamily)
MQVVVSAASTAKTLEQASLISEPEHCLPLKMLDAHLAEIVGKVDMVFVPRILSSLKDHISCPKLGALPDAAKAQTQHSLVLTVDIDENKISLEKSLLLLGKELGVDKRTIQTAIKRGMAAMQSTRKKLSGCPEKKGKRFLILSHPYNLYDDFFSGPILCKLERMSVAFELAKLDQKNIPSDPIKWDTCSKMYDVLQHLTVEECAGVLQISSFNCGCDSISMQIFQRMLRDKGIPYMTLVLDEHSSQSGIDTRLEAFVDSTRW